MEYITQNYEFIFMDSDFLGNYSLMSFVESNLV